jgi:hypothetical protein
MRLQRPRLGGHRVQPASVARGEACGVVIAKLINYHCDDQLRRMLQCFRRLKPSGCACKGRHNVGRINRVAIEISIVHPEVGIRMIAGLRARRGGEAGGWRQR